MTYLWRRESAAVEDDAVAGLAGFEVFEGLVDVIQLKVLGDGADLVARGKVEHLGDGGGATHGGGGEGELFGEHGKDADVERLEDRPENMEASARPEGCKIAIPIEGDIDRGEDHVEGVAVLGDGARVTPVDGAVGAE